MSASCSFSNGFDSGFEICVAAPVVIEPSAGGGGAGGRVRYRRLRAVELTGTGRFAVLGIASLSVDRSLKGMLPILFKGAGLLSLVQSFHGRMAKLRIRPHARVAVEASVSAALEVATAAFGQLRHGFALAGEGSQPFAGLATASLERGLQSTASIYASLDGDVEVDDEETALFLLGLPSEILT